MLSKLMFQAARSDLIGPLVRFTFSHVSGVLPVRRLVNTPNVVGFHHPKPWQNTHVLLVPKAGIPNLLDVDRDQAPIVVELLNEAKFLGRAVNDGMKPMSLVVNGGRYQDVGQLHFHLVSGARVEPYTCATPEQPLAGFDDRITIGRHPKPKRPIHYLVHMKTSRHSNDKEYRVSGDDVVTLLQAIRHVVDRHDLGQQGFSIIASAEREHLDYTCFHLVSG